MTLAAWLDTLRREVFAHLAPSPTAPAPGLYTYPVALDGGQRRIHLRVEADGAGVLFADVTDAVHLNPTAVLMVKLALDGVPLAEAEQRVQRGFSGVDGGQLHRELAAMYELVARFQTPVDCPTCAIDALVTHRPLFSTPVNAPFKVDVALTYACNNACAHCYNEPGRVTMPSLPLADWFRVFDRLAAIGVPHVILTGGEPTLLPDLPEIVRYADGLGHIVGMNTNGRRLAEIPLMAALAEAGLNHVQVTLEADRAAVHNAMVGADAFAETVGGIEAALDSGIHVITNTTLTRQNLERALPTIDFLHSLGLRTFAMNGIIHAGSGRGTPAAIPTTEMASLLSAVRERAATLDMRFLWYTVTEYCQFSPLALDLDPKRCNAAEYSMCIEPNGDVLPCQSYYQTAGNLLRDPWDAIWNSDLFLSFRERETRPGLPDECYTCLDLEMCGGGCPLERAARVALARPAERGCGRARGERQGVPQGAR